jgi:hypothetical protein
MASSIHYVIDILLPHNCSLIKVIMSYWCFYRTTVLFLS